MQDFDRRFHEFINGLDPRAFDQAVQCLNKCHYLFARQRFDPSVQFPRFLTASAADLLSIHKFSISDFPLHQIMLYNYEHFTYLYANGERFDMTETDRYTVFANSDPINIRLTLSNIPAGSYKISETYVNRKHGSSFDQWVSMGALEPTSLEEYDLLKKASVPGFHQSLTEVSTDGILKLDAQLELLEIRLIQISPVFQ